MSRFLIIARLQLAELEEKQETVKVGPFELDHPKDGPQRRNSELIGLSIQKAVLDSSYVDSESQEVSWNGADDPEDPHKSKWKKWFITLLTSGTGFMTLMTGTMMAPALGDIGHDLGLSEATVNLSLSILVLAFTFGPMFFAPMTELYGRRPVWIYSSAWYALWNIVCGFASNNAMMIVGRFLSGLGASAEFAVTQPVFANMWRPRATPTFIRASPWHSQRAHHR